MSRWGKDKDAQAKALRDLSPEEAYREIAKFCSGRTSKKPPTIAEVKAHLGLTDNEVRQAAPPPAEGLTFDMPLLDDDVAAVGLDSHQNKHQVTSIAGLAAYRGGGAQNESRYRSSQKADYHRATTAPIVRAWLLQINAEGKLDPPGKTWNSSTGDKLQTDNHAHLFVATAKKDARGKLFGSYHCYPAS